METGWRSLINRRLTFTARRCTTTTNKQVPHKACKPTRRLCWLSNIEFVTIYHPDDEFRQKRDDRELQHLKLKKIATKTTLLPNLANKTDPRALARKLTTTDHLPVLQKPDKFYVQTKHRKSLVIPESIILVMHAQQYFLLVHIENKRRHETVNNARHQKPYIAKRKLRKAEPR